MQTQAGPQIGVWGEQPEARPTFGVYRSTSVSHRLRQETHHASNQNRKSQMKEKVF